MILNTCSIRDHAEQKVYSYLGPHALRKRKGENVCIVVAGCVAQQEGEKLLRRFPEIDIVMGPQYAPHLTDLLIQAANGHQVVATDPLMHSEAPTDAARALGLGLGLGQGQGQGKGQLAGTADAAAVGSGVGSAASAQAQAQASTSTTTTTTTVASPASPSAAPPLRRSDVTGFVNVIFGCGERCTYCVVPSTRGVEQSRTREAILGEVAELVAQGYGEVTLLGQNIDSWGRDFTPKQRFADLLEAVGRVPGLRRVRFLTSHPKYMSARVIAAMAANPAVLMPNVNVPFQSGSNRVLRLMRRGYTRERYLEIVQSIRAAMPDAAITADCIVGFPGETEEDFQATLELMERVQFDVLNTAAYSARPHTPAADWEEGRLGEGEGEVGKVEGGEGEAVMRVPEAVKQERLQRINALGEAHALARSRRFLGRVMPVLVEDVSVKNPSLCVGRIPHSRLCYFQGDISQLKGRVVDVEITEAKSYSLVGRLVARE